MDFLPASVQRAVQGGIDPYTQHKLETWTHIYLGVVVTLSFIVSYLTQTVLVPLEIFLAAFVVLCLVCGPAWPFMNRYRHRFLPARTSVSPVKQ